MRCCTWAKAVASIGRVATSAVPVRWLVQRIAAGGTRQGLMVERSTQRFDFAAVLGLGSRRTTRCVRCAHCARTGAASRFTKRAVRADPSRALLAAPQIAPAGYRLPRSPPVLVFATPTIAVSAKARPGRRQRACGAPRSTGFVARARSAPRDLTCRTLSERRERSERSELCDGPQGRAPQGSRCAAPTAPPKRCRLHGRDFAARLRAANSQANSGTISIAPQGHSAAHTPQPLQ
jgi:hypothetical protein